jgi:hypothetical protein
MIVERAPDPAEPLVQARTFVAAFLHALRRADLAGIVDAGGGDDFPEVQIALALLGEQAERRGYQQDALRQYADPGFWDDDTPGGSLALHDRGEMAANALAGHPAFFHRD